MKTVRYSVDALRSLSRHGNVAARLRKAIEAYAAGDGAHANNVRRPGGSPASRLRVGDVRLIFEESESEVIVTRIAPRGEVYD